MTEAEWRACGDPRQVFRWLCQSGFADRSRLGLLFSACCDLIPPTVAEPPATTHWSDDEFGQIALTDAEFHLSQAVHEAMRAIGNGEHGRTAVAALIHDIFGNPFRSVAFLPEWRNDTTVALARTMYDARDFSAMPILADALQDAGCDNDDILAHCRASGGGSGEPAGGSPNGATHVRGCWVVDLVLGKE